MAPTRIPKEQAMALRERARKLLDTAKEQKALGKVHLLSRRISDYTAHSIVDKVDDFWTVMGGELADLIDDLEGRNRATLLDRTDALIGESTPINGNDRERRVAAGLQYLEIINRLGARYEITPREIIGTPLADTIMEVVLSQRHPFLEHGLKHGADAVGQTLREDYAANLAAAQRVATFDLTRFTQEYHALLQDIRTQADEGTRTITIPTLPLDGFAGRVEPTKDAAERAQHALVTKLKRVLVANSDWSAQASAIIDAMRINKNVFDNPLLYLSVVPTMFGGVSVTMQPKESRKVITLDDLIGYDAQKQVLCENVETMLQGDEANHVFIYGPPGTGKSSVINGLLHAYQHEGLRVLDIQKPLLGYLGGVLEEIRKSSYKFILFVDEFKVGKGDEDKELFNHLKKLIEGSFDELPINARLYVVSNTDQAMRMGFGDTSFSDDEVRSLEDRFGLMVRFGECDDKDVQRRILGKYLGERKIAMPMEDAYGRLLEYCKGRRIAQPSGRTIRDFVKTLKRPRASAPVAEESVDMASPETSQSIPLPDSLDAVTVRRMEYIDGVAQYVRTARQKY